ncbi:MAG: TRAP transporter TatT component family protein [Candidatus Goldbacteria bacterium]|nr:TRAP transporter TatT component family protein [Candidatus Goldiibacteriota bacterium]
MSKILINFIMIIILVTSCSIKRITIDSTGLFMDDISDSFFEEGDIDFAEQAIPANLKLLDGLIKGSSYENDGLLLKGCKMFGMYAMGFLEDANADKKIEKKNLKRASAFYEKAKDYGFLIFKKKADFKAALEGTIDDFIKIMPAFNENDVELLFWTAFAWGSYINLNRTSPYAIADLPKVKIMMERVIELNDKYFYGLPHLFMIVYYSMPKMFGGNLEKAKEEYDKITKISDNKFILADFFMAKYYAVQAQDKELFIKLLDKVENAPDDIIKEKLFTQVAKKKAAVLKERIKELF